MQQKWIRWMTHRDNLLAIVPILGFLESSYTGKCASCQNIDIGWPVILLLFYIVLYFSDIQSIYLLQQNYFSRNCIKCATHRTNLCQHWQQIINHNAFKCYYFFAMSPKIQQFWWGLLGTRHCNIQPHLTNNDNGK